MQQSLKGMLLTILVFLLAIIAISLFSKSPSEMTKEEKKNLELMMTP
jgi:hypothetical protein